MAAESFVFSASVKRAMAQRDAVATGTALLDMGAGFRALWVDEHKKPYAFLTPHAAHDATNDPRILQEWSWYMPDANLAIVWPPGLGCIDCDDTYVVLDGIPSGTWGEQTRRGEHHLVTVPTSVTRKRRLPHGAGDFLAGPGAYTVLAPSSDRWPFDLDAPILPLHPYSSLGRAVLTTDRQNTQVASPLLSHTVVPEQAVAALHTQLRHGSYGDTVTLILDGRWAERYPSRSEADCSLAFLATHYTDNPDLIAALLTKVSHKAREHRDARGYISLTVGKALAHRERSNAERRDHLRELLGCPDPSRRDVYVGTPPQTCPETCPNLRDALLTFAAASVPDAYTDEDGWRRVPVDDVAALYGVHRKTVWRHLCRLEEQGRIARAVPIRRSDKGARKDSLLRLVEEPQKPGAADGADG